MKAEEPQSEMVVVEPTYPHKMLLRINKLFHRKKRKFLDQNEFLQKYQEAYEDCEHDIYILKYAYERNIINEFSQNDLSPMWKKRVFVRKAMLALLHELSEKDAAILLESMMYAFRWNFSVKMKRIWEAPEDERAKFHDADLIQEERSFVLAEFSEADVERAEKETESKQEENPKQEQEAVGGQTAGSRGGVKRDVQTADLSKDPAVDRSKKKEVSRRRPERKVRREPLYDDYDDDYYYEEELPPRRRRRRSVLEQEPESVLFYRLMTTRHRKVLKKALAGDVVDQCAMGDFYSDVNSVHLDYKEAIRWYEASAEKGYERAYYEMGKIYDMDLPELPKGKQRALEIYTKLAKQGFPTAQCVLGMKYWLGDGVEVSRSEAISWLQKAALQHHETAIRNLADLYHSIGDGENALKWYRIGASCGNEYCRGKIEKTRGSLS